MACCIYFFFICHSDYELLRKRDLIDLFFNACVDNPIEITLLVPLNFMGGVSETEMAMQTIRLNIKSKKQYKCSTKLAMDLKHLDSLFITPININKMGF